MRKWNGIVALLAFGLSLGLASPSAAQLGGLLKKKPAETDAKKDPGAGDILTSSGDLLQYVTLASDLGVKAAVGLAGIYPPERMEAIRTLAAQYGEMTTKRTGGNVDASQFGVATQIGTELAKLKDDWHGYRKDSEKEVGLAKKRLGLMLLADAQGVLRIPETILSLQGAISDLTKNPLAGAGKVTQLKGYLATFVEIGKSAPSQVESYKAVNGICKSIAEAEGFQLPPDPPADAVKDTATFQQAAKDLEDEPPAEAAAPAAAAK